MYLRWRGATLADLRDDPDRHRRPDSLPADPLPAGDGMVAPGDEPRTASRLRSDGTGRTARRNPNAERPRSDDDWGADAFLADVGTAYGTTPEGLREGLELLVARDRVWVSPGIPFLVPILIGLLIGLTYGDPLIAALVASGLA
jgi:archaeal preflagellin peptidase FlaK